MGIGLLLSCVAMAVAGIVKRIRRNNSVKENFSISALWLVPQFGLIVLAYAFNAIGQMEFYYRQLPKSMSSILVAFFTLGAALSGLLGGLIISVLLIKLPRVVIANRIGCPVILISVTMITIVGFLLSQLLSVINCFYFVICCWCYGP
ncbi:hypothetical protein MKW98_021361 [Papaver atlanticum]|uniref:Uncharacterized protein n=1 Tax=Papaver atlanticum TaxID=357466 RepID=A0AAD4SPV8_9MAGN|nr:hypothetical protein MKW98_021361 [Papaver atlanticum]